MTKIDDTYQIRSFTFTMCPWQVLLLKEIPSNFLSATYSSSNYHHIVGQFSHGEKPDSKSKVAFDIFTPSRILFMLKRVKNHQSCFTGHLSRIQPCWDTQLSLTFPSRTSQYALLRTDQLITCLLCPCNSSACPWIRSWCKQLVTFTAIGFTKALQKLHLKMDKKTKAVIPQSTTCGCNH